MSQASLAMVDPILIDAVAITDQDALPLFNQGEKGLLGVMGVNEVERYGIGAQGPKPLQRMLAVPGRLIDIAHFGLAGQGSNGFIVRQDSAGDPINQLLHRAQTHGDIQDGVTEIVGVHRTFTDSAKIPTSYQLYQGKICGMISGTSCKKRILRTLPVEKLLTTSTLYNTLRRLYPILSWD
jgi:hypothetical protein